MTSGIGRFLAVVIIAGLFIAGLNTSNMGINQVSGENRGPVLSVAWQSHTVYWDWLGQRYEYSVDPLSSNLQRLKRYIGTFIGQIRSQWNAKFKTMNCNLIV